MCFEGKGLVLIDKDHGQIILGQCREKRQDAGSMGLRTPEEGPTGPAEKFTQDRNHPQARGSKNRVY